MNKSIILQLIIYFCCLEIYNCQPYLRSSVSSQNCLPFSGETGDRIWFEFLRLFTGSQSLRTGPVLISGASEAWDACLAWIRFCTCRFSRGGPWVRIQDVTKVNQVDWESFQIKRWKLDKHISAKLWRNRIILLILLYLNVICILYILIDKFKTKQIKHFFRR